MSSSSKLSLTEDEQHRHEQLQQEAKQGLQSPKTAKEKMVLESENATPSPRRKLSSLSSGSLSEISEEDEIATVRRKTQKVNFGPVNVVVLESEELLHDLSENLQSALAKASPKPPPAPPPMHTCPSPPRCEQHMTFNAARRKARVRSA
eukprot:gnl/MRDRNA2_/MRDRNA2_96035_c0_seq1.p1 gnl/MRDRNA2_/MRDRNA2_96035_c0~~gnl/MRDRNA2_/MRDRNA2_96035_c0_seq1.p1  ORF type:complete len:175 (+),score=33.42 gnl/MRDRNA2_/MRDRNA2_96035_c0_seq1:81-527(+)